ncbi:BTAD domain-containing putative transcriptional regulator [Pseudonocardia sp.]|uniref:BTAD domain-containing putative transcriptional regulator n=1 Tax=Pseudonocardia sp. TaxID=60912 RepID=UPI003D104B1E
MTGDVRAGRPLRLRDLGPLEIERAGVSQPVGGARLENALALLLIHAGHPVGVDALGEAMWGDGGVARSVSTLDSHIFRLRRLLEPQRAPGAPATVLLREPGGYRLAVGTGQVDSTRFAQLATTAAALLADGDAQGALRHAEEAAGLWRGRPYGVAADQQWARAAVARLEEIRGQLRETRIGALLGTGAVDRALAELEAAIVEDPLRERLWLHRMTAYRDGGRRAEALQAYVDARTVLVDELGVEPGAELRALHAELLRDAEPAPADPPSRTLPTVRSRLVGREREVADVLALLGPGRLVTLVGAAGCGKTRLAVEVAHRAAGDLPDGVWFVDLTVVSPASPASPQRVLDTVTSTLGLPVTGPADPTEALLRYTASRRMLVVLDNCEHVLDGAAELADALLVEGTALTVLATSREPLEVDGEEVAPLAPLPTPAAVELFLDRLDALAPGGVRDGESLATVREIATAVDGLPLALELAAARARAYTLPEIASQVRADASSLSRVGRERGGHHRRTIRDAIDTSYRDLPAALAELHRAAGAVPGPFTAGLAAGLVGAGTAEVLDGLAGLVHRSLLSPLGPARPGGVSRFAQLATVRGHAEHLARRRGEEPGARRDAWVERLVRGRPALGSPAAASWYRSLDDDLAALRATLQHTLVDVPSGVGVALAARLGLYWGFSGMGVEGARWLETAASVGDAADDGPVSPVDRAMAHLALGSVSLVQGRLGQGRAHVRAGIAVGESLTGDGAVAVCEQLAVAVGALARVGDGEVLAEVAAAARRIAADVPALDVLVRHTELVHAAGTAPRPELVARFAALYDDARVQDNHYTAWTAAAGAARLLVEGGRPAEALPWCRAALRATVAAGLRDNAFVLEVYGAALGLAGEHVAALRVFGAVEAQHRSSGVPWPRNEAQAGLLASMTTRLGKAAADRARAEGARTTLADFVGA